MCFSYEKSKIGAGYAVTFDILFEDLCVKNVEECPIFANTRISNSETQPQEIWNAESETRTNCSWSNCCRDSFHSSWLLLLF